jgi:hypothetical protein
VADAVYYEPGPHGAEPDIAADWHHRRRTDS